MTREEKLEAIYKEMANKELTFGCKVKFNKGIYSIIDRENVGFLVSYRVKDGNIHNVIMIEDGVNSRCYSIEEIIGHPVMIGDVLVYFEKKDKIATSIGEFEGTIENPTCIKEEYYIRDKVAKILYLYASKIEPIEKQSDECIDYVYSLIKK